MLKKKIYSSLRLLMVGVLLYITGVQPQPVSARANQNDQGAAMAQIDILAAGTYDDSHASMQYTNGWKSEAQSSALNGAHRTASLANEMFSFTFYGGQFDLMYTGMPSSGVFSVTIDGAKHTFNSSQSATQYRVRWLSPSLPIGQHTVVIQKQFNDNKPIYVDGVIIYGPSTVPTNTAAATNPPPASTPSPTATLQPTATLKVITPTWTPAPTSTKTATPPSTATKAAIQVDILAAGTYDDGHASMQYTNGWKSEAQSSALNGAHRKASLANEMSSFTFYGGQFDLIYTRTSSSGAFSVTIDGTKHTFNSSQAATQYRVRWLSPSLPIGQHTVVIQKQLNDNKPIYVDGIIVYGPLAVPTNTAGATNPPPASTPSLTATIQPTVTLTSTPTVPQTGVTYYVSTTGNDAASGSQTTPWRTIQKAANIASKGDTIIVLAGNYPERVKISRSGEAGKSITFQTQGTVITKGFTLTANYVTIRGFEITNTPDDSRDGWGIWVNGSGCLIENNYVHYATRGGINLFVLPGKETVTQNCVVKNNRLYRNAFAGIEVHGRNHIVESNEIWGTIQYHPNWLNPPTWVDADGIRFHGSGHVISKNYIHDILFGIPENRNPHIDCFQTFADGSYHEAASNIVFEQNTCINMQSQSPQEVGKAFMIEDANGLVIRNNILRAYRVLQALDSNNLQIVNNVFTNKLGLTTANSPSMITLNNTPNSLIRNNTFFDPLSYVIYFENSASQQGVNISHNNAYRSDGASVKGTAYPNDLWNVNPMFVNPAGGNFRLQAVSPLINKGVTLSIVKVDFDGKARPQGSAYDIGAFEWSP